MTHPRKAVQTTGIAVAAAALGVGATLAIQGLTSPHDDTDSSTEITGAVTAYVTALNNADTSTIGALSCGLLKQDFDRIQPNRISEQLSEAIEQRGPARVSDFRNISIDGDRATTAGIVSYTKNDRTQANLTIYGLKKVNSTWKLCWSEQVSSAEAANR